jgi:hypothetical protein
MGIFAEMGVKNLSSCSKVVGAPSQKSQEKDNTKHA